MRILTPLTILLRSSTLASSSSSCRSSSPHFLHFVLSYSTSIEELPRKRGELVANTGTSHSFSSSTLQNDDLSRNVRVSVWWDFENCGIPNGVNAVKIAQNITSALRCNGIRGPITITAFGDFIQINRLTQECLAQTGISLSHVPNGGKNTADRSLLADLVFWVSQNPPPAHIFIISRDKDYANILHRLRMNNYNILLASHDPVPSVLCSAASIMWVWNDLARGESFSGKHFNEPPDGPQESWYGYSRGALEDPFPDQAGDFSDTTISSKPRAIPKSTVSRICQIVNSYPMGIDISELRTQLVRSNVPMDRDFFGHKKFSMLLKSLPGFLRLRTADSQIFVHSKRRTSEPIVEPKGAEQADQPKVAEQADQPKIAEQADRPKIAEQADRPKVAEQVDQPKVAEPVSSNLRPTDSEINSSVWSRIATEELKAKKNVTGSAVDEKLSSPAHSLPKIDNPPAAPVNRTEGQLGPMDQEDSVSEVGFFRRVWTTVFGHKDDPSTAKRSNSPETSSSNADSIGKREPEERSISSSVSVSAVDEAILEETTTRNSEEKHKSSPRVGMFNKIVKWWSGETSTNLDNGSGYFGDELNKTNNQSVSNDLFSRLGFWEDMRSFLHSPKGAAVISQSKTREQMARQLQMDGPSHLTSLGTDDLIHLVDLLVSQKKWVEQSNIKDSPFKLLLPAQTPAPTNSYRSSELSSMFGKKSSLTNLQGAPGQEREDGKKKDTQSGAFSDVSNRKLSGKSKSEIISDSRKLVAELFREHPEGFNMGIFRDSFRERYGYNLNYQPIGYLKLATLLQTIPGVDIVNNFVVPSNKSSKNVVRHNTQNDGAVKVSNSVSELPGSRGRVNDYDSLWNELGPIESSDSEEESPKRYGSYRNTMIKEVEPSSSLVDMLNSWDPKDDRDSNEYTSSGDEVVECSRIDLKPSPEIGTGSTPVQKGVWKKPRRTFSFIAETVEDENGKLVNELDEKDKMLGGILGSIKQTSGARLQN